MCPRKFGKKLVVPGGGKRNRSELQPGDPAFCAGDETGDLLLGKQQAMHLLTKAERLRLIEQQLLWRQMNKLAPKTPFCR
ncbi:hypothetical protein ACWKW1_13145 [Brevibacillus parabrevis]